MGLWVVHVVLPCCVASAASRPIIKTRHGPCTENAGAQGACYGNRARPPRSPSWVSASASAFTSGTSGMRGMRA